jgi:hypothetical protein
MSKRMNVTKQNRKWLHLGFALEFILLSVFMPSLSKATTYEESVNQFCAYVVGIPYASDNFTDEEWKRFKFCRDTLKQ